MVQRFVFESDEGSELASDQADDLVRILRSLAGDSNSFEKLRVEISGESLPPLTVTPPADPEGTETAVTPISDERGTENGEGEVSGGPDTKEREGAVAVTFDEGSGGEPETDGDEADDEIEEDEEVSDIERQRQERKQSGELSTINPGTRRFSIGSVLFHADGYLTTSDIVEFSQGEDWEMNQSSVSSELYRMYGDYLVHRRQQQGTGGYEYWLTDRAEDALAASDEERMPNPFAEEAS